MPDIFDDLAEEYLSGSSTPKRINAPNQSDKDFRDFFTQRKFKVNRTFGKAINPGSLHPYGLAADVDINGKSDDEIGALVEDALNNGYRVFDERVKQPGVKQTGPHLHFERNNGQRASKFIDGRYGSRNLDYLNGLDQTRLGKKGRSLFESDSNPFSGAADEMAGDPFADAADEYLNQSGTRAPLAPSASVPPVETPKAPPGLPKVATPVTDAVRQGLAALVPQLGPQAQQTQDTSIPENLRHIQTLGGYSPAPPQTLNAPPSPEEELASRIDTLGGYVPEGVDPEAYKQYQQFRNDTGMPEGPDTVNAFIDAQRALETMPQFEERTPQPRQARQPQQRPKQVAIPSGTYTKPRQLGTATTDENRVAVEYTPAKGETGEKAVINALIAAGATPQEARRFVAARKRDGFPILTRPQNGKPIQVPFSVIREATGRDIRPDIQMEQAQARTAPEVGLDLTADASKTNKEFADFVNSAAGKAMATVNPLALFLPKETRDKVAGSLVAGVAGSGAASWRALSAIADAAEAPTRAFEKASGRKVEGTVSDVMRQYAEGGEQAFEKLGYTDNGWKSLLLKTAGRTPGDVARLILLSKLPGGIVTGMAADAGLQSAGRQEPWSKVAKETIKGGTIGLVFKAAPYVTGIPAGYGASSLGPTMQKAATEAGTVAGIMYGTDQVEKLFGTPDDQAFQSAVVNGVFHLSGVLQQNIVGKIIRANTHDGKTADVTVSPEGEVKLLRPAPERTPDIEMYFDEKSQMYRAKGDTSPVREKSVPAQLKPAENALPAGKQRGSEPPPPPSEEAIPMRGEVEGARKIDTPDPEAVKKVSLDTRARKVTDALRGKDFVPADEVAKLAKLNTVHAEDTIAQLYKAGMVEITPDNKVRLIGETKPPSLYERITNEKTPPVEKSAPVAPNENVPAEAPKIDPEKAKIAEQFKGKTIEHPVSREPLTFTGELNPNGNLIAKNNFGRERSIAPQDAEKWLNAPPETKKEPAKAETIGEKMARINAEKAAQAPRSTPAPKEPKELKGVKSLSQAARAYGGIKSSRYDKGEAGRIRNKETGTTGLINNKSGIPAEQMAVRLWEDGYLRDVWPNLEDVNGNELMQHIEDDLTGAKKHYSQSDRDAIAEAEVKKYEAELEAQSPAKSKMVSEQVDANEDAFYEKPAKTVKRSPEEERVRKVILDKAATLKPGEQTYISAAIHGKDGKGITQTDPFIREAGLVPVKGRLNYYEKPGAKSQIVTKQVDDNADAFYEKLAGTPAVSKSDVLRGDMTLAQVRDWADRNNTALGDAQKQWRQLQNADKPKAMDGSVKTSPTTLTTSTLSGPKRVKATPRDYDGYTLYVHTTKKSGQPHHTIYTEKGEFLEDGPSNVGLDVLMKNAVARIRRQANRLPDLAPSKLTPLTKSQIKRALDKGNKIIRPLKLGDFYEFVDDDADIAHSILKITKTHRNRDSERPIPMAGVPYYSYENAKAELEKAGFTVGEPIAGKNFADAYQEYTSAAATPSKGITPLTKSQIKRSLADGASVADVAKRHGLTEEQVKSIPALGEKGEYGQTSYMLRRQFLSPDSGSLLQDTAQAIVPDALGADTKEMANAILDTVSEKLGKSRSSRLDDKDWNRYLNENADKLPLETVKAVERALAHQAEWFKKRDFFVKSLKGVNYSGIENFDSINTYQDLPRKVRLEVKKYGQEAGLSEDAIKDVFSRALSEYRQGEADRRRGDEKSDTASKESGGEPEEDGIQLSQVGNPGFYSQAERIIEQKMPNKASIVQIKGILSPNNGVKKEELDWLDIDSFLRENPNPTKQELLDYVRANNAVVQEVVKGSGNSWAVYEKRGGAMWKAFNSKAEADAFVASRPDGAKTLEVRPNDFDRALGTERTETKFSKYTLPGGENYRELLLVMPPKAPGDKSRWDVYEAEDKWYVEFRGTILGKGDTREAALRAAGDNAAGGEGVYTSSHWSEPNVLAHVRFDDRDGGETMHVAEIQSDWHQEGRKKGYSGRKNVVTKEVDKDGGLQIYVNGEAYRYFRPGSGLTPEAEAEYIAKLEQAAVGTIPNAPFKSSWPILAFKHALKYAVENGYKRITWDTGETNAERYDLSKHVSEVMWNEGAESLMAYDLNKKPVIVESHVPAEKLEDYVGKEVAQKLLDAPYEKQTVRGAEDHKIKRLKGLELKVGGSGMRGFYDKILPAEINKYVKKFGGKVEEGDIGVHRSANRENSDKQPPKDVKVHVSRTWNDRYTAGAEGSGFFEVVRDASGEVATFATQAEAKKAAKKLIASYQATTPVHSVTITPAMKELVKDQPLFNKGDEALAKELARYKGLGNLANVARFEAKDGVLTYKNAQAGAIVQHVLGAAKNVKNYTNITGGYSKGGAKRIAATAKALYGDEIGKIFADAIDPKHNDLTINPGFKPELTQGTVSEEFKHRGDTRSGVVGIKPNATPLYTKAFKFLQSGAYKEDNNASIHKEVIGKLDRNDGPESLGLTQEEFDDLRAEHIESIFDSGITFDTIEEHYQQNPRFLENVRQRFSREAGSDVARSGGADGGAAEGQGNTRPRFGEESDRLAQQDASRLAQLRQADLSGRSGEGTSLTPADKKWFDNHPDKDAETDVQLARVPDISAALDKSPFIRKYIKSRRETGVKDIILNVRKAGLLSSLKTHFINNLSNASFAGTEEAVMRPIAAMADIAASAVTGERTVQMPNPKAMYNSFRDLVKTPEYKNELEDFARNYQKSGVSNMWSIIKNGDTKSHMDKLQLAETSSGVPLIDAYVNYSFRTLSAEDAFYKTYAFRRSLEEQAKTIAITDARTSKGLSVKGRTEQLLKNPSPNMQMKAIADAEYATYQNDNLLSTAISKTKNYLQEHGAGAGKTALDFILPFDRTPTNIVLRSLDYTPLGFARSLAALRRMVQTKKGTNPALLKRLDLEIDKLDKEIDAHERMISSIDGQLEKLYKKMQGLSDKGNFEGYAKLAEEAKRLEDAKAKASQYDYKSYPDEIADLKKVMQRVFTRADQELFAKNMGRATGGTSAFIASGFALAAAGLMTGLVAPDDSDRTETSEFFRRRQKGIEPGSIYIPGVGRFQIGWSIPGRLMAIGASIYEETIRPRKGDASQSLASASGKIAGQGVKDIPLLNAVEWNVPKGKQTWLDTAGGLTSSFIPAFIRQAAEASDDQDRVTFGQGFWPQLQDKIPVWRESLKVSKAAPSYEERNKFKTEALEKMNPGGYLRRGIRQIDPFNTRSPEPFNPYNKEPIITSPLIPRVRDTEQPRRK